MDQRIAPMPPDGGTASLSPVLALCADLLRDVTGAAAVQICAIGLEQQCVLTDPDALGALYENRPLMIADLREHPAGAGLDWIAGRATPLPFAAFPLQSEDGFLLGALCLLDLPPGQPDAALCARLGQISAVLTTLLKQDMDRRGRLTQRMEGLLGELHHHVGVEDMATALCFLRLCEGLPATQRDTILLPAAGLADLTPDGQGLAPSPLARHLMRAHGVTPPPPSGHARGIVAGDLAAEMLARLDR